MPALRGTSGAHACRPRVADVRRYSQHPDVLARFAKDEHIFDNGVMVYHLDACQKRHPDLLAVRAAPAGPVLTCRRSIRRGHC